MRSRLRSASVLDGALQHGDPVLGPGVGERRHRLRAADRLRVRRARPAPGEARAPAARISPTCSTSSCERERDVADDRVAHRRARGLARIARDRDERRALGQQRTRDVRVVGEHRRADDQHEVVTLERLGQRRRSPAGRTPRKFGMALGEPEPAAAGGGRAPIPGRRCFSASATAASQPPLASMSGPGDQHRVARRSRARDASCAERGGVGHRAAADDAARRPARRGPRRPACSQSSIGIETNAGPRGGSEAWWIARASATGTSCARGGLVGPLDVRLRRLGRRPDWSGWPRS